MLVDLGVVDCLGLGAGAVLEWHHHEEARKNVYILALSLSFSQATNVPTQWFDLWESQDLFGNPDLYEQPTRAG